MPDAPSPPPAEPPAAPELVSTRSAESVEPGFAVLDADRLARTGDPEVVFGAGKTPAQTVTLLRRLHELHPQRAVLATRCGTDTTTLAARELSGAAIDEVGGTIAVGPLPTPRGRVAVVVAGTSDLPVARECVTTVEVYGAMADLIVDVGVAGLHRLLARRERIEQADAVVVIAGMDGALPSVVGGLVRVPVVAVPTSVGYGAAFGGVAALLTMLNACAPGVSVVNIDNGYGGAVVAARIARQTAPLTAR
ncbi:nickel pincer cofactor biosynthesis protein LarB [Nakamurella leprariae]|uniref:Nickel pincer cofactor biosynthesis protein LarB n=1 Tax=Nakamurella leprariae TaxID=2803911 RepID=A0A938YHW4_9ACTN|nr:nickel pincer cofactor biosynthesis protein LarB [Nakamurella leprariae]MBM9468138.1 nickel pincer cofactor biosynthesis protein LarB [Nakamurella leprariae]